jgi:hypothetical protein
MYEVPGMTLIPQERTMSCWYASARMLVKWKMDRYQQSFADLIPPELDAACRNTRDVNTGIGNAQVIALAKKIGLATVPPMSPTPRAIEDWLRQYGPLWVNGKTHIVVIAGIMGDSVKVYDPAPMNSGSVAWRSLLGWYVEGKSGRTYIVKRGDTLAAIARRLGMSWQYLYNHSCNAELRRRRQNPSRIYPGDVINIPSPSQRDVSAAVQAVFLHCP